MKILQVNCVYKNGSTGKIVYDIHSDLAKNNYESIVCYGRRNKVKEKIYIKFQMNYIQNLKIYKEG